MSCSVLQDEPVSLADVPEAYHDLRAVFSKSRASSLPPHRPYDCAIDLLPGTSPPKGHLYSLSRREAMERYIHDSLVAGIIRPSSSPAGAWFFFMEKRDGSFRPCIDYRGVEWHHGKESLSFAVDVLCLWALAGGDHLYEVGPPLITWFGLGRGMNGRLPLTHIPGILNIWSCRLAFQTPRRSSRHSSTTCSKTWLIFFIFFYLDDILVFSQNERDHVRHVRRVLQRLLENHLFAKVEKCQFHARSVPFLGFILSPGGVRMDPTKVKAVSDWPTPDSCRAVQRFLGFAYFYRWFIRNFSQVDLPLMDLTSTKKRFYWSPQAQTAFENLKSRFILGNIIQGIPLTLLDSSLWRWMHPSWGLGQFCLKDHLRTRKYIPAPFNRLTLKETELQHRE